MPKSIAVFGAGPALGQAVARRYAREGYTVTLVARRPEPLERMAAELIRTGAIVHAVAADLSGADGVPGLADQIRSAAGDPDVLYYGPTISGVLPAAELTPQRLEPFLRVPLYTLVALVREFLPHMIGQHDGAILVAAGASAVRGLPNFSGPGPALAAQRNYVQSLHAELAADGVYAGGLYIGATIEYSAFHARVEADAAAGRPARFRGPLVSPGYLADLLWTMHQVSRPLETLYPEDVFSQLPRRGPAALAGDRGEQAAPGHLPEPHALVFRKRHSTPTDLDQFGQNRHLPALMASDRRPGGPPSGACRSDGRGRTRVFRRSTTRR